MLQHIVVTLIGPDRPGIINALSEVATAHGANWLDSHMANLAGQFAGMVLLEVRVENGDALQQAVQALDSPELRVSVAPGDASDSSEWSGPSLSLEVTGHDQPGIVRDISSVLANLGVSIAALETDSFSASWTGDAMFRARAQLRLPASLPVSVVHDALEALSGELMVDLGAREKDASPVAEPAVVPD